MIRKIIKIDESKCNGCGLCAKACHEGAIGMIDGKAKLMREDYCDGLGDCLPACPAGAISFEEREAAAYDHDAVMANKKEGIAAGCPSNFAKTITQKQKIEDKEETPCSRLLQWPVQIKLAPVNASYFDGADLLIAADCTAYAYGNFHNRLMKNKVTLIGCPKLDMCDYSTKLRDIIVNNQIKSLTVVMMEVPCCGGIEAAAKNALQSSGKSIPWQVVTVSTEGEILP